jgi:hypothetical protein
VIVVRLARAPYLLDKQAHSHIAALSLSLDNKTARQAALNLLWALRKEGVSLREKVPSATELSTWLDEWNAWRQRVYAAAEVVSVNLRNHLETLNEMGKAPSNLRLNGMLHLHAVEVMSEILRRMERYLEKDL